jgi:Holliday junction resolvase-like predicted endonuclease
VLVELWRLLLSIIKLTREKTTSLTDISDDSLVSENVIVKMLTKLADNGKVTFTSNKVATTSEQRIGLAVLALKSGADAERVCKYLSWREFEDMVQIAMDANGFRTKKHLRFKSPTRRYEVDVIGLREPLILAVDCKHWKKSWQRTATKRVATAQLERTEALATNLDKMITELKIKRWKHAKLIPLIVTLSETPIQYHNKVPIVTVHNLQDFVTELPSHVHDLAVIDVDVKRYTPLSKWLSLKKLDEIRGSDES